MALHERHADAPTVDRPVLVVGMEGWIDAGLGAGAAMAQILSSLDTAPVATFDIDTLLDHRARRPTMRIEDGVNTGLSWPEIRLLAARSHAGDVLLLVGPEPDHQWRAFTAEVVGLATELGVRLTVGLGAFPAPVPHTRPVRLASTATTPELARLVGFVPGTIDVPAGVMAAIEQGMALAGIPAVGLWARVPHYVAAMPYPAASVALLEGLEQVAGLRVDASDLATAAGATAARIQQLIEQSAEHRTMVASLEAQVDTEPPESPLGLGDLPTGDEIAAELERFLRGEGSS